MTQKLSRLELAEKYHAALPPRIREYLNGRGILDTVIDHHLLGWDGYRITIPIFSGEGELLYFRLAKDPDDKTDSPKMVATRGAKAELYGWERLLAARPEIIICEGEFDRLVLECRGLPAVSSTAGAGTFRSEWAEFFKTVEHVYICFDRDQAGRDGALLVGRLIPQARIVELPEEVGEGGDITDFFVRLGKRVEDFVELLRDAKPAPPPPEAKPPAHRAAASTSDAAFRERVDRVKEGVAIDTIIARYIDLRPCGDSLIGLCPFHGEVHPSLTVYPQRQNFHCYGCKRGGDVITFVEGIEKMNFWQALEFLERLLPPHEQQPTNASQQ